MIRTVDSLETMNRSPVSIPFLSSCNRRTSKRFIDDLPANDGVEKEPGLKFESPVHEHRNIDHYFYESDLNFLGQEEITWVT